MRCGARAGRCCSRSTERRAATRPFDVTPAELVSALVTERGVAQPVDVASVAGLAAAEPVRSP